MPFTIGWFSSGRDQAARDLLATVCHNISSGFIPGQVEYVLCNRDKGETQESDHFLSLAHDLGIRTITVSSKTFLPSLKKDFVSDWRRLYHEAVMEHIKPFPTDLIILAGYMLIVSPEMCRKHTMINLHPAAPGGPAGTWQEVIWQLMETDAVETGIMMHLVTEGLDEGPPMTYCTFPIRGDKFDPLWDELKGTLKKQALSQVMEREGEGNKLFQLIREEGVKRELPLIVLTLKALTEGRAQFGEGRSPSPCNLNSEIESYLAREQGED